MSLKHHLKMWFQQKIWSKPDKSHSEETVALPEVHTGKVHHPAEDTSHATGEHPHSIIHGSGHIRRNLKRQGLRLFLEADLTRV